MRVPAAPAELPTNPRLLIRADARQQRRKEHSVRGRQRPVVVIAGNINRSGLQYPKSRQDEIC